MMGGKNGELLVGNTRFALLYNVQGLKYTIGKQFDCRDCQGEFFFCKGNSVSETSHCRITCEAGGQFWVKDLQGLTGRGTFINGERIVKSMELKFGDYLSLGGPGVKPQEFSGNGANILNLYADLWEENHCTFLFRAVEAVSESQDQEGASKGASQGSDDVNVINVLSQQSNPLKNSLVLSKIFGHLPSLSDVKNCRLVCSVWKEEATKLLKTNAIIVFKYSRGYSSSMDRSRLFSFVQEMGGFFTRGKFRVKLPVKPLQDCNCSLPCWRRGCTSLDVRGHHGHKMVADLTWFFDEGFRHPITKLSLKGTLRSASGRNLYLAVLQGASLTLEDLELDMNLDLRDGAKPNIPEPFEINFPALKRLSVSINTRFRSPYNEDDSDGSYDSDTEYDYNFVRMDIISSIMKKWINSMINAAPALKSLKLNSEDYLCRGFAKSYLNQLININNEQGFPNLNSLNLNSYDFFVLEALMKLPILESLTLGASYVIRHYENGVLQTWTELMERVLQKSAQSLKYFDLTLPNELDSDIEREVIWFPVFPKLKVFELRGFYNCVGLVHFGLVSFEDNFPVLSQFAVYGDSLREKHFFDVFFPQVGNSTENDDENDDDKNDEDKKNEECGEEEGDDKEIDEGGEKEEKKIQEKDDKNSTSDDVDDMSDCDDGEIIDSWKDLIIKNKSEEQEIINSVQFLEIENLENWSRRGVDKIDKMFPNAFNKYLEARRAKALAKPKWNWSKWCFVSGAEQIPTKIKKRDQIHTITD